MKPKQKDEIMKAFAEGEINILVSTTVVEVGVNVPNASVMMIENAERFGLASLHQLRGRVGRGKYQSYCIFMNTSDSKTAKERLDILNESYDGFVIANKDLKLRGQGDMFGTRQSGEMYFKLGDIIENSDILLMAVELSEEYMKNISKVNNGRLFENEFEKQAFMQKVEKQIKTCIETICL
jgi:ATP-dependent DNA helicase RecG